MSSIVLTPEMLIPVADRLGEVKEYYFSRKLREIAAMRAAGQEILNLGIGSPDLPPDPKVLVKLTEEAEKSDVHGYQGYAGLPELRAAFSDWYERFFGVSLNPNTEVLPLIGSKEGLMHIAMTFLQKGDEALVPNPGYPAYASVTELSGATVRTYELSAERAWLPDLDALAQTDLSRVKIMWVNYPHMPTGTPPSEDLFERLVAFAKKHQILLVHDNPYAFILNEHPKSIFSVPDAKAVAIELSSLSKSHNMAGWRVGVLAARQDYKQAVLRFKSNMDSGMFRPLQLAAAEALQLGKGWYDQLNATYAQRRMLVYQLFDVLDCEYEKQQVGLFVWAKIPNEWTSAYELSDRILEHTGVFITPGGIFGSQGDRYLRISLCSDVLTFDRAMQKILIWKKSAVV